MILGIPLAPAASPLDLTLHHPASNAVSAPDLTAPSAPVGEIDARAFAGLGPVHDLTTFPVQRAEDVIVTKGDVSTTGDNMPAIATQSTGATTIGAGDITTSGANSDGVHAIGYGPISIETGSVATGGYRSDGIYASTNFGGVSGGIDISADNISTQGFAATGVRAQSYLGDTNVTVTSVNTSGYGADGIYASSGGDTAIKSGAISTTADAGRGIVAYSDGTTTIVTGDVTTTGQGFGHDADAGAIKAVGAAVDVQAGNVATGGDYSSGIYANSNFIHQNDQQNRDITVAAGNVTTTGFGSDGIDAIDTGPGGNVSVTANAISTAGEYSWGVYGLALYGNVDVNVGPVGTTGDNAPAIKAESLGGDIAVSAGQVTTAGNYSAGVTAIDPTGGITVDVGAVSTTGLSSDGIDASTALYNPSTGQSYLGGMVTVTAGSISTAGDSSTGIRAAGRIVEVTLNGSIDTAGAYSRGIFARSYGGATIVHNDGSIATQGVVATGIYAGASGNVTIDGGGSVSTTGTYSTALVAFSTGGSIAISQGDISTTGDKSGGAYAGIRDVYGTGFTGDIAITVGDVATRGDSSNGIYAFDGTSGGAIAIRAGEVTTRQDDSGGIRAVGYGETTVTATSVGTRGSDAHGIYAVGHSVDVNVGTVSTLGDRSDGIYAVALASGAEGPSHVTVDAGSVSTSGDDSSGIKIFDNVAESNVAVKVGSVTTTGNDSFGIDASSQFGNVAIDAQSVTTSGRYSTAVAGHSIYGDVTISAQNVTTSGFRSNAVDAVSDSMGGQVSVTASNLSAGDYATAIYARGGSVTVDLSGTIDKVGSYGAVGVYARNGDAIIHNNAQITAVDAGGPYGSFAGIGIGATATGKVVIDGKGSIATDSDYGTAVQASSFGGSVTVSQDTIVTHGTNSFGIAAVATDEYAGGNGLGEIGIAANNVTTSGSHSFGVAGSDNTKNGSVLVTVTGAVTTAANLSTAVSLYSANGIATARLHDASTQGDESQVAHLDGHRDSLAFTGTLGTAGALSTAVVAYAGNGGISIDGKGSISTTGAYFSAGIRASSPGAIDISVAGSIATTGRGSAGIEVTEYKKHSEIFPFDDPDGAAAEAIPVDGNSYRDPEAPDTGSLIGISAQSISTQGKNSDGIMVSTVTGSVDIATGTVSTAGLGSIGIFAEGRKVSAETGNTSSARATAIALEGYDSAKLTVKGATKGGTDGVLLQGYQVGLTVASGGSISGGTNGVVIDATPHTPVIVGTWGYTQDTVPPVQPVGPSNPAPGVVTVDNEGTIVGGTGYAIEVSGGSATIKNDGTLAGAVLLSSGNDTLTNSGTFVVTKDSDFGAGNDLLTNSGTVAFGSGTKPASVHLLGLETFANSGVVDMRNGVAGNTLSLVGTYVGSGGAKLGLDVGANGVADKLVVTGAATGSTTILINGSASTATLLSKPVTLVQAGAGTSAGAFSIAGGDVGFVRYGLGFDAATNSFALTAKAGSAVRRIAEAGQAAQAIWRQSADAWSSHLAQLRDGGASDQRVWGQAYGKVDTLKQSAGGDDLGFRQDYYGAQAGVDLAGKHSEDGHVVVFGLTGGYLSSHINFRAGPERLRFDTENLGGYAALRAGPLFANLLGQYAHYHVDSDNGLDHWSGKFGGNGYGAEAEVGARLGGDSIFAEPVASLAWQKADLGTLHALGQSIDIGHGSALTGKLGARIGGTSDMGAGGKAVFYARASYVHSFHGQGSALLTSGGTSDAVTGTKLGDYGEGALGVNLITAGRLSGFLEGDADIGHSYKGGGGRVGIGFKL